MKKIHFVELFWKMNIAQKLLYWRVSSYLKNIFNVSTMASIFT